VLSTQIFSIILELEKVFKNKLNALADSTSSLQVKDMFSAFSGKVDSLSI
jgi:hypothetical protein